MSELTGEVWGGRPGWQGAGVPFGRAASRGPWPGVRARLPASPLDSPLSSLPPLTTLHKASVCCYARHCASVTLYQRQSCPQIHCLPNSTFAALSQPNISVRSDYFQSQIHYCSALNFLFVSASKNIVFLFLIDPFFFDHPNI